LVSADIVCGVVDPKSSGGVDFVANDLYTLSVFVGKFFVGVAVKVAVKKAAQNMVLELRDKILQPVVRRT
jgi:hypothetical protein